VSAFARFRAALVLWLLVRFLLALDRLMSSAQIDGPAKLGAAGKGGGVSAIRVRYGASTMLDFKQRVVKVESFQGAGAMGSSDFSATVSAWVEKTKRRMEDVVHTSSRLLAEAVVEGTPDDGGALAQSFRVSGSAIPVLRAGASPDPASAGSFGFDAAPVNQAIFGVPLGGMIYMGFTAPHAAAVEFGTEGKAGAGMVRLAAQQWSDIVEQAVRETA